MKVQRSSSVQILKNVSNIIMVLYSLAFFNPTRNNFLFFFLPGDRTLRSGSGMPAEASQEKKKKQCFFFLFFFSGCGGGGGGEV